ncbi:MAG TPA: YciI family protein [Acidimicrobiia bacterium]|jgi:hypothetical protein|nr:YciI family protein [Acidimicrobiia bacterium]
MPPTFAYVYTMTSERDRIRATAPAHAAYWEAMALPGYVGGPFEDRTGGLILFDVENNERAQRLVKEDPFTREGLLDHTLVKEWRPAQPTVATGGGVADSVVVG